MRIWIFCLPLLLCSTFSHGQDLGWLQGEVTDAVTGEGLAFTKIQVLCGPQLIDSFTDYDGMYVIRLPYGPFALATDLTGYSVYKTTGVTLEGRITFLDIRLERATRAP